MIEQPSNGDAVSLLLSCFNLDTSRVKFLESIIGQSTDLQTAKSMLYLLKESQEKEKAGKVHFFKAILKRCLEISVVG